MADELKLYRVYLEERPQNRAVIEYVPATDRNTALDAFKKKHKEEVKFYPYSDMENREPRIHAEEVKVPGFRITLEKLTGDTFEGVGFTLP